MTKNQSKTDRRSFLKQSAVVGAAIQTLAAPAVLSAANVNDQVRVGFIGVGNRGSQLLASFLKQSDVTVAALCDVYEPYLQRDRDKVDPVLLKTLEARVPKMGEKLGSEVARYKDYRRLLEQKDIDAVVIATPDHWHAIQMTQACDAGKDVYVEKPLSLTVSEGRKMVQVAERTGRIVQVGLHRRSSNLYSAVHDRVQEGSIGKVTVSRAYRIDNMYPDGIGHFESTQPLPNLDWDLWLGPQHEQTYQHNITPYKFRWWQNYSSQIANWGVHYFDTIRWVLEEEAPVSISAHGGRFALHDDRTIPDTMEITFELPKGSLLIFGQYEASGGSAVAFGEIEFRGTLANLYAGAEGEGFKIIPSRPGQFQKTESPAKPLEQNNLDKDLTDQHVRNFVDCVKSRKQCNCTVETAQRSTTFAHLANIALATKTRLEWDAKNEKVLNSEEANRMLSYEYRKPWTLG